MTHDDSKPRLRKWGAELTRVTSAAGRDGCEISALIMMHGAVISALAECRTGAKSDTAEVFWQLSRLYDDLDSGQHATSLKYSDLELEAAG